MGAVWTATNNVSATVYKNLGMETGEAAKWASLFGLAYSIKPLWAPFLEVYKTKKFFVIATQLIISALFGVLVLALGGAEWKAMSISIFLLMSFVGATQDIAADGVYVTSLAPKEQAKFTGFQSMCWSIGPILANGVLVTWTGKLHDAGNTYAQAWQYAFAGLGVLLAILMSLHALTLPKGESAEIVREDGTKAVAGAPALADVFSSFSDSIKTFFQKEKVWLLIGFAFLYRTSQGFLDKIGALFMIEDLDKGGLGLSNTDFGYINGTVGTGGFLLGAFLGGLFVSKVGLKRSLLLLCAAMNVPNATYIYLAVARPESIYIIGGVVTLEKFFFGFGSVAHMLYMMQQLAPGKYRTAHYAFGTGLMGLCITLTGYIGGATFPAFYEAAGNTYVYYFIFVMVATIPSFWISAKAPFIHSEGAE